jgi:predicted ABC-type sugar transport system permease subunit
MPKEKTTIGYRIVHWFTYHPWLKIIALVLAVMVWFYVQGEIGSFNY